MRRRRLTGLLFGASMAGPTVGPSRLAAQPSAIPVIGNLDSTAPTPAEAPYVEAYSRGLAETGFSVGRNVRFERRYAEGHYDRLPALAADLVSRKVAIITTGSLPSTNAAKNATPTIPIVFTLGTDPIAAGVVSNLARPGGNLTGVSILNVELLPKRFDLLCELVPRAKTVALLVNPANSNAGRMIRDAEEAGRRKEVRIDVLNAANEQEIDAAFEAIAERRPNALLLGTDPVFSAQREQLIVLAARHRVPTIFGFATAGGLISYGTNLAEVYRQAGVYAGLILKGT